MVQATEVFTPTDVPTLTYVKRASRNFEADLRDAFKIPKMIVSISGPSKSGKTVLVTKVVAPENLIHIYGASIKTPEDLWSNVLTWMGGPIERTETASSKVTGELSATAGGKGGIPLVAEAKADIKGGVSADSSTSTAKNTARPTLMPSSARSVAAITSCSSMISITSNATCARKSAGRSRRRPRGAFASALPLFLIAPTTLSEATLSFAAE